MEPVNKPPATGRASRPVFGATTMRRGADFSLPVNLTPTAMAAEMRSVPQIGPNSTAPSANPASTARRPEIAEAIGQEELPLRGASAIGPPATNSEPVRGGEGACLTIAALITEDMTSCPQPIDRQPFESAHSKATPNDLSHSVPIEIRAVPSRGGRPKSVERYPFATLPPIQIDAHGDASGPGFLIPEADGPERRLAAARKRYGDKRFISRRVPGGTFVWRES
jgi:hypothetical protein